METENLKFFSLDCRKWLFGDYFSSLTVFQLAFWNFGLLGQKRPKSQKAKVKKIAIMKSSSKIITSYNPMRKIKKIPFPKFWPFFGQFFGLNGHDMSSTQKMLNNTSFATIYVKIIKIAMEAGVFSFMYCAWKCGTPLGWLGGLIGSIILCRF